MILGMMAKRIAAAGGAGLVDLVQFTGDGSSNQLVNTTVDLSGGGLIIRIQPGTGGSFLAAFSEDGTTVRNINLGTSSLNLNTPFFEFANGSFKVNVGTGITQYALVIKKQAGLCDIVPYTGNFTARSISHTLGQTPQFMMVVRNGGFPSYRETSQGNNVFFTFLSNARQTSTTLWNNAALTSTTFPVGANNTSNQNTIQFYAILLGNTAGISNCGSYTGTAGAVTVSSGLVPDWILTRIVNTTATAQPIVDTIRTPGFTGDETAFGAFSLATTNIGDVLQVSGSDLVSGTTANEFNSSGATFMRLAFKKG